MKIELPPRVSDSITYKVDLSFEEAVEQFFAHKGGTVILAQTVKWYREMLNAYGNYLVENEDTPTRWTHPDTLNAYLTHMHDKGLAVSTIIARRGSLVNLFKWMEKHKLISASPMRRVPRPSVPKKEKPPTTEDEILEMQRVVNATFQKLTVEGGDYENP